MSQSIVCFDGPDCSRKHAGGMGGIAVHPPAGARISGDEPIPGYGFPVCYIDNCGDPATYIVHSYPDTVRLCDRHKSLHPVEIGETVCAGARCRICGDAS